MNTCKLSGAIYTEPEYSHQIFGEKFYKMIVEVNRLSGNKDYIPCIISEIIISDLKKDDLVMLIGEIRSRNEMGENEKRKLSLSFFVQEVCEYPGYDENEIRCDGFICKPPTYRSTPLGRQITDVMIASNRCYKSDYLPCICWERIAKRMERLDVGKHITFVGRFQSREYSKKLDDGTEDTRTAYEISINNFEVIVDDENSGENENEIND